ncbi:MAG: ribonuclease HII [Coriobacteriia bacterium]|nr:ribonuclease HII [Coriobacteriia bacterium]
MPDTGTTDAADAFAAAGVVGVVGVQETAGTHEVVSAHTLEIYRIQHEAPPDAVIVGIDEVGRGAVAGPLTVAAVVLPRTPMIEGLDDSKKLSARQRERLCVKISQTACAIGIAHVEAHRIDTLGMAYALRQAMCEALAATGVEPDLVLIDGTPMHIHPKERAIVKGDALVASIAAASIVAKVTRDAIMSALDETYPAYGFAQNKGYASAAHIAAIQKEGLTELHRATFCQGFLQESLF